MNTFTKTNFEFLMLAVPVAILLSACSKPAPPAVNVRPVYVSVAQPAGAVESRFFTATVRTRVETDLAFRVSGKVAKRLVDVGTNVRAGQALMQLDDVDYALAVKSAEDQVRAARVEAEQSAADELRFRRLSAEGSASSADHERQKARAQTAVARLDQSQRQMELAKNRNSYTTLH